VRVLLAIFVAILNAPVDPGAQPLDVGATLAGKSFTPVPHTAHPRSTTKLQLGNVIGGRYEILELLGEGGMGAVYKAADREFNRFVALKLIRSDLASNVIAKPLLRKLASAVSELCQNPIYFDN
jgi:hypothetical protein